jgi:hypothetical protein
MAFFFDLNFKVAKWIWYFTFSSSKSPLGKGLRSRNSSSFLTNFGVFVLVWDFWEIKTIGYIDLKRDRCRYRWSPKICSYQPEHLLFSSKDRKRPMSKLKDRQQEWILSYLAFYFIQALPNWMRPLMSGRAICFTQFTNSSVNLIQKHPHVHPE